MSIGKIADGDKFCRVTVARLLKAISLEALIEGGLVFRGKWNKMTHCERVVYRHYFQDGNQGWQP